MRYLTLVVALLFCKLAYSQQLDVDHACSYVGKSSRMTVHTFASDGEAETIIANIMQVSGLPQNFEIKAAGVENAAALIDGGKRYILYNQTFIHNVKRKTGSEWAAVSILAHEIGHHLSGHTVDEIGSRQSTELEADKYSGFILQKLGASLKDSQLVMNAFGSVKSSRTHPAKHDRLAAIANGWRESCGADCSGEKAVVKKRTQPKTIAKKRTNSKTTIKNTRSKEYITHSTQLAELKKLTIEVLSKYEALSSEEISRVNRGGWGTNLDYMSKSISNLESDLGTVYFQTKFSGLMVRILYLKDDMDPTIKNWVTSGK